MKLPRNHGAGPGRRRKAKGQDTPSSCSSFILHPSSFGLNPSSFRGGATLVEAAIILPVFLILVLGLADLAIGVERFNSLSEGARHAARQAIVHGQQAPDGWDGGAWGPDTIDVALSAEGVPVADAVRPLLVTCDPEQTRVVVEWLDGSNTTEKRVRVTLTTPYRPLVTFIFGNPALTLRASSTMPIAH
jgi:hypothetical protein